MASVLLPCPAGASVMGSAAGSTRLQRHAVSRRQYRLPPFRRNTSVIKLFSLKCKTTHLKIMPSACVSITRPIKWLLQECNNVMEP